VIERDHQFAQRILGLIPVNSLDERLQGEVLAQGELLEFKKKKVIFEEGARDAYTFYLLDGELELQSKGAVPVRMIGGDNNANRAIAQLQPRRYTAKALTPVSVFRIERGALDHIISDEQVLEESGIVEVSEIEDEDGGDWMTRLISSELFTRLPHDNIQRFFAELEAVEMAAGDLVVEQGTQGDYLYIVAEGKCAVTRRASGSSEELQLALLSEGDAFGEESLISNTPRNASVKMLTPGFVMRLPKKNFEELVSKPTLKAVPYSEACKLVEEGARWLDVRFADEHSATAIEDSFNIPLNVLRVEASKVNKSQKYVLYCDTGARSSTGAFLLARQGFDVCYLAGGLERTPLSGSLAPSAEQEAAESAGEEDGFEMVSEEVPTEAAKKPPPDESKKAAAPKKAAQKPKAKPAAKPSEKPAKVDAAARPAQKPGKPKDDSAAVRQQLAKLKAERDKAAVYAKQAVDAAKELKRRNEEQARALKAEQEKRETLQTELAAARADAERQSGMELSRLQGDLEKTTKKLAEFQKQHEQLKTKSKGADDALKKAVAEKNKTESLRVAAEVAFQDKLQKTRDEFEAEKTRAEKAEKESGGLRAKLEQALEDADRLLSTQEMQKSDLERAMKAAGTGVDDEKSKVASERSKLEADLEKLKQSQKKAEEALGKERAALERETAAQKERAEALDRREMGVEEHRNSLEAEVKKREEAIAKAEAALGEEKSDWKKQVEKAIAEERKRLETAYAKYKEEAGDAVSKAARELADEQLAELRTEFEAKEVEANAQFEVELAEVRLELAEVRAEYETRLGEQEALLEDERRRVEAENVQLRAALSQLQRTGKGVGAVVPPQPEIAATAVPDLTVEEAVPSGSDLEVEAAPPAGVAPKLEVTEEKPSDVPTLEVGEEPSDVPVIDMDEAGDETDEAVSEKKARILTPNQLAELRRKMQDKMAAQKKSA
jgi:CRP-like cAMP-binding protein